MPRFATKVNWLPADLVLQSQRGEPFRALPFLNLVAKSGDKGFVRVT